MDYKLGDSVLYVGTDGYPKLGLIVGTPDSTKEGDERLLVQHGYAHLVIFSPTGVVYYNWSVPSEETARAIPDYTVEGQLTNYFKAI